MPKQIKVKFLGVDVTCEIETHKYQRGGMAVVLQETEASADGGSDEPPLEWTLSCWFPETALLPEGAFYVKDWSENTDVVKQLIAQGELVPAPFVEPVISGFVTSRAYTLKP